MVIAATWILLILYIIGYTGCIFQEKTIDPGRFIWTVLSILPIGRTLGGW